LKSIPTTVVSSPILDKADAVILLDTNNLQQLGDYGKQIETTEKPVLIIDHHTVNPETKRVSNLQIVDEQASSTCEIIFDLFKQASVKPRAKEAQALFIGIAYDTRHFSIANSKTFRVATELINLGAVAEEALALLEMSLDTSERVARLKAARRVRVVRIGEWVIVLSNVSSYQASAARALIGLGAHIAVVGGIRGKLVRVNMRSSREFFQETGIHLGRDIAEPLGRYLGGFGGGHGTSAGVNGESELKIALSTCLKLIREKL
jgi:nanoRNase/pAp phosphatase (c-di-AMP/oligoRNAs hydrolase)